MSKKGLVYAFVGEGKGKTSAALGVMMRMLLCGEKVAWISWYKTADWPISERAAVDFFPNLEMHWGGKGFYIKGAREARVNEGKVYDTTTPDIHSLAAKDCVRLAREKIASGEYKLIVLDEVLQAITDKLIEVDDLRELVDNREDTNIVLTGRVKTELIIEEVDLLTEMRKIKHPFDSGMMAVKGLDY